MIHKITAEDTFWFGVYHFMRFITVAFSLALTNCRSGSEVRLNQNSYDDDEETSIKLNIENYENI